MIKKIAKTKWLSLITASLMTATTWAAYPAAETNKQVNTASPHSLSNLSLPDITILYENIIDFFDSADPFNTIYQPKKFKSAEYIIKPKSNIKALMPYSIQTDLHVYKDSDNVDLDVTLSRNVKISDNWSIKIGVRGIAGANFLSENDVGSNLNELEFTVRPYYRLFTHFNVYFQYQHDRFYDELAKSLIAEGKPTQINKYSVGVTVLF